MATLLEQIKNLYDSGLLSNLRITVSDEYLSILLHLKIQFFPEIFSWQTRDHLSQRERLNIFIDSFY